jgi:hypothetical protein
LIIGQQHQPGAFVNTITGGTFEGTVALQNDLKGVINEISGGKFMGWIRNSGYMGTIGGKAYLRGLGQSSNGIYNASQDAWIEEISGGMITSEKSSAISNAGTISLISGGTIIGYSYSIFCSP